MADTSDKATRPPCRKCLLAEMSDQRALYELIGEYIAAIPEEQRAEEGLYQRRLDLCTRCEWLVGGMCGQCGCYVEVRAARAWQRCPDVHDRWR